jgi:hypothetical protein
MNLIELNRALRQLRLPASPSDYLKRLYCGRPFQVSAQKGPGKLTKNAG